MPPPRPRTRAAMAVDFEGNRAGVSMAASSRGSGPVPCRGSRNTNRVAERGAGRCVSYRRAGYPILTACRYPGGPCRERTICPVCPVRQHPGCPIRWAPSRRPMARTRVSEVIHRTRHEETRGGRQVRRPAQEEAARLPWVRAGPSRAGARRAGPGPRPPEARRSEPGPRLPRRPGGRGTSRPGAQRPGPGPRPPRRPGGRGTSRPGAQRPGPGPGPRPPRRDGRSRGRGSRGDPEAGERAGPGRNGRVGAETPEARRSEPGPRPPRRPGYRGSERTFRRYIERCEDKGLDARADKRMHQVPAHRAPVDEGAQRPSEPPGRTVPDAKSETDQNPPNHH